ncbi:MAG: methyl-accepting chemotaxis protein [Candidatus Hydrothermarchaeales archaeon]
MKWNDIPLKIKLISLFLILSIVPLSIVGIISYNNGRQSLEAEAINRLEVAGALKENRINGYFAEREGDAEVLAEMADFNIGASHDKLEAIGAIKANQIESYFGQIGGQVMTLSEDRMIIEAMKNFKKSFHTIDEELNITKSDHDQYTSTIRNYYQGEFLPSLNENLDTPASIGQFWPADMETHILQYFYLANNPNPTGNKHLLDFAQDGSSYSRHHKIYHPIIRDYLVEFGYYDIFLVDPDTGHIVYSVFKEVDYATSLSSGPYRNTNFAEAFRKANAAGNKDTVILVDFDFYDPSYHAPASFIASPIYDGSEKVGVLVFQMPLAKINGIMTERSGLGESGETYLVSMNDKLMRSDSRFSTESTILKSEISTAGVQSCKSDIQTGIYPDYRGVPVMGAYRTLDILGLDWCLLSEIDQLEALTPQTEKGDYFKTYIEVYGYYDLFLINPDGLIYYTVTRESDYNTNCIDGEYKDTNLCKIFREASSTGEVTISDIEFYAPSNDAPAGFIAAPVFKDGELITVVAMQIATGQIDEIMQLAEGMGETGESYLVGRDMKFRSNSRLTTTDTMLVVEVNTKGPQEAFKSNAEFTGIYGDYTTKAEADAQGGREYSEELGGVPVLGVNKYLPHVDWVLVSEIDEAEAFAPAADLKSKVQMIGLLAALIVAGLSFAIAMSIIKPVNKIAAEAKELAKTGNLSIRATVSGKDEIGQMATSLNDMLDNVAKPVQELGAIAEVIADGDLTRKIDIQSKGDISNLVVSFQTMVNGLKDVLSQVSDSANYMAASSQEMSSAAEEVNATAEEVAAAVAQISQGTQDQASKVEIVSANANASAKSAGKAKETAETGGKSADGAMQKMDLMNSSVAKTAADISGLGERSKEIGQIVDVITSIAEQTNLLALNAAIEAARAGEHGKGFAVVADEVRKLAEESKNAADRIANLINEIQGETDKSVQSMEGVTTEVKEGSEVVTQAGEALKEIVGMVDKLADDMDDSVKAIDEIAAVVNETASSSEEVSASTEELTASMEEVSSSAQQLADLATNLQTLVGQFKLDEHGVKKKTPARKAEREAEEAEFDAEPEVEAKIQRKVTKIRGKKTAPAVSHAEEVPIVVASQTSGNGGDEE